ncbi:CBS domain-containing protein [Natronococcus sp. JC468]|uniref:M50 family metallopeptidase n=1 Tax=Natronococcus sp. JC468 TaxID=1961921 RepID=UPI0014387668|nr:M50 family metallopeptidase [Natronococcus sp. JC468]NKE36697.1 CBS domain-containing protein [Natronococcus sp. JC468]
MASVRIGTAFGIPIKLGASFLLVVPLLAYLIGVQTAVIVELLNTTFGRAIDPGPLTEGATPWLLGLTAALGLFVSVFCHELGHAMAARRYGLETESITLWFLGGLAQFTEMPEEWQKELVVAIAGPIVSVAVGALCYAGFVALPAELSAVLFVLGYLAVLNVVLAIFNMLPGFPMDGGRVLRALLSRNRSRLEATRIAAGVGKWFAILLGFAGIVTFSIFWIAIAFFIYIAASSETQQIFVETAFEGLTVAELMTPAPGLDTVSTELPTAELLDRMLRERHTGYPVLEDGSLVGIVTLEDVQERAPDTGGVVRDAMSTDPVTIPLDAEATTALRTLQEENVGRLLVVDADGSLAGLLSRTDLMTALEVAQGSRAAPAAPRSIEH